MSEALHHKLTAKSTPDPLKPLREAVQKAATADWIAWIGQYPEMIPNRWPEFTRTAEAIEREVARLVLSELERGGSHDGACTNEDDPYASCELHVAAATARRDYWRKRTAD